MISERGNYMKKVNGYCPLQSECKRTCEFEHHEKNCDYYIENTRPGFEIAEQEETAPISHRGEMENTNQQVSVSAPNSNLVLVDIDKIYPHPQNPRKNLGDLTELADSIKVSGVLQNLTIVPKPDGPEGCYYAVIGHRRHAGAKKAGLKQVPCVISEMDEKEQIRTMMVENMQRSDLTVYEEAGGFQMMMDLGDTVSEIAAKTGFSNSTVRHRVKLLDLDREKFQKASSRNATLQDYMALEKIKDINLRNEVLDSIGTANFNNALKRGIDQESTAEKKAALLKELDSFAIQIEQSEIGNYKYNQWISLWGNAEFKKPEDAGQRKYFYTASSSITLYTEKTEQEEKEDIATAEKRSREKEKGQALDQIAERAYQLRFDFVKGLTNLKKKNAVIYEMAIQSMLSTEWNDEFDSELFFELLDLEVSENEDFDISVIAEVLKSSPERVLIAAAYANFADGPREKCHNWRCEYDENEQLGILYGYLERLGYEISDEEKSYQDGTHSLFTEIE